MAHGSDPDGFCFPPIPGVDEDVEPDDINIPVIYQRVVLRRPGDYDRDYAYDDDCPDEFEDEHDQDFNLDLTAPPLESWYHGRISRQTASDRLEMFGRPGAYLVRESVGQPGDYAISYLSHLDQVHHFKINSNCGDYYIGGRQFYSLNDLIGFYSNASCILENESLEVPVVPPEPVSLYMMLRATESHIKTPGTDELTIETGEVFLLLSFINQEWGWGRSQNSEMSGLIPIVIMEDVTHEDTNLGKPWFHDSVGREEAVELLMRKGTPGSYLVRKSRGGAHGGDEINYSMAVRTTNRVQRFLITRYVTGYYLFGGRPFNSMEDVIDRYRNEVILDGLNLGSPLPKEPEEYSRTGPQRRVENPPSAANHEDVSQEPQPETLGLPAVKEGTLLMKKGKKCPVYGKWKEFHFVVQCKEKKLLYYEQGSRHRAKGLLDLRQCKVYEVHPSLMGPNCMVLVLKYLSETTFYYLSADFPGNTETVKEWLRALWHCTYPPELSQQNEVQQARSLSLVIKDCKMTKSSTQVFALAFVEGVCVARTRVMADTPCVFDEDFVFEDLPLYATEFTVELHTTRSKRLGSIVGRENCLGRVQVHLSDLPCGQDDDRWHQLVTSSSRAPRGSVRLSALFKDYVILPIKEYAQLKELVLSGDLKVIEALAKVCKDHHAELASTLIHIFCYYNRVIPLINACLAKSVDNEENVSTLFRAATLSTMLMDQLMKLTSLNYLRSILTGPVKQIMECPDSSEISPALLPKGADPTPNQNRLQAHVSHVLSVIFASVPDCPPVLRYIYHCLQKKVGLKWPEDDSVTIRAISGFLFLRFVCPALLKPQLFGLVTEPPSPVADRALKLVTKTIQNLANLVGFKTKESFMLYLNAFIKDHMPLMRRFVDEISMYDQCPDSTVLESLNPAKDLSTICHLCNIYTDNLNKLATAEPRVRELLEVLNSLKRTEKRYTNRYS